MKFSTLSNHQELDERQISMRNRTNNERYERVIYVLVKQIL